MVSSFEEKYNSETGYYEINPKESIRCSLCGGAVSRRGRKKRTTKDIYGSERKFLLRRLKCKPCDVTHTEMPDIIQPYKHYDSAAIQSVIDGDEKARMCAADDSTMQRWRRSFADAQEEISQRLASVHARMSEGKAPIFAAVAILAVIRAQTVRWLAYVMHLLINGGHRLCAQFAFCPSSHSAKITPVSKNNAERGKNNDKTIADTS